MNTYYEVQGNIDGNTEILFGSFSQSDALYELDAERGSWIDEGYTAIRVKPRYTEESADPVVYADDDDVDTSHCNEAMSNSERQGFDNGSQ